MRQHTDAQYQVSDVACQREAEGRSGGTLLGSYSTAEGHRHVRAIATAESGLCVIDEGADGALLVESRLEGIVEARALAADYLSLACERGEPQVRHPWPADGGSQPGPKS